MNTSLRQVVCGMLGLLGTAAALLPAGSAAATRYVWTNSPAPAYPYTNWSGAARTIQVAVSAAGSGDTVLITNGVYELTNQIEVAATLTLRSVSGAARTTVNGGHPAATSRCFHVTAADVVIEGLTITNGTAPGLDTVNYTDYSGGGVWSEGNNTVLRACRIAGNRAERGGGVCLDAGGLLQDCDILGNRATWDGGGVCFEEESSGTLDHCTIVGNVALYDSGGGVCGFGVEGPLRVLNCFVAGNRAVRGGGLYFSWADIRIRGCTVSGNTADERGGGAVLEPDNLAGEPAVANSIFYFNTAPDAANCSSEQDPAVETNFFRNSCTTPLPGGAGNTATQPGLLAPGNPHLVSNSVCINAGAAGSASGALDVDGEPRTNGPAVDIGCDEYWPGGITGALSVAIAAQYTNAVIGFPLEFVAAVAGRAHRFEWQFGDGQKATNTCVVQHAYAAAGTFPVVLTAWNGTGMAAATTTVRIAASYTNYVSLAGSHTPPFTNWVTAATTLQAGVEANSYAGGVVLVATGTYDHGGFTLHGSNRVAIYRPLTVVAAQTNPALTVIRGAGPVGPNAVRCAYVGPGARLVGFTLTNGCTSAGASDETEARGGGVYGDPDGTVSNCRIVGCASSDQGGGVFCRKNSALLNCAIGGNAASSGGGVYCEEPARIAGCDVSGNRGSFGAGLYVEDTVISNCTIAANEATGSPGGVLLSGRSLLVDCAVVSNRALSAGSGGGVLCQSDSIVRRCTIANNRVRGSSSSGGGGICLYGRMEDCDVTGNACDNWAGGAFLYGQAATAVHCRVIGNNSGWQAGGVGCWMGGTVLDSEIRGNSAPNGGGLDLDRLARVERCLIAENYATDSGGGFVTYLASNTILNCVIANNRAKRGGGGAFWYAGSGMSNCLVTGNTATEDGGGVYASASGGRIESCTIAGNRSAGSGGGVYGNNSGVFRNCVVWGNTADGDSSADNYGGMGMNFIKCCAGPSVPPGTGNIAADPVFLAPAASDYRLATNSPCIDQGTNQAWMAGAVDLDGQPRVLGARVDMGVFELGRFRCAFAAAPLSGPAPLAVQFAAQATGTNAAGLRFRWDFTNDGVFEPAADGQAEPIFTYTNPGAYTVRLAVSNAAGEVAVCIRTNLILALSSNVFYVSPSGAQIYPYTTWSTAARTIESALAAAPAGSLVLVSNGCYAPALPVWIEGNRTVRSVGGAAATIVDFGGTRPGVRLAAGSTLAGFTLRHALSFQNGGGVYLDQGGEVRGCVIEECSVSNGFGGGVYCNADGLVADSTVRVCRAASGGGVHCESGGTVQNVAVVSNVGGYYGGGVYCKNGGAVTSCRVIGNAVTGTGGGGGVYCQSGGTVDNSLLTSNSASLGSGGGIYGGTVRNSLINLNTAAYGGGAAYCDDMFNCTVVGNEAAYTAGGVVGNGPVLNSIVYFNTGMGVASNHAGGDFSHSCTTPDPGGDSNIVGDPLIAGASNPHLLTNSPCLDAGDTTYAEGVDIDGEARVAGSEVDIGCDELAAGGSGGPLAAAILTPFTNAVVGFPLEFAGVIQGKPNRFAWQFGDGQRATNVWSLTHAYATTGTFAVALTAWNNDTAAGATVTVRIVSAWTNYVSLAGSHTAPFTNWATAATTLQAAVDANLCAGGVTLVAAGSYAEGGAVRYGMSNRVVIAKPVTVRAAGTEPALTVIRGAGPVGPSAVRCAFVGGGGHLVGFTLTNGATHADGDLYKEASGGGLLCEGSGVVSNCTIAGNSAQNGAGGALLYLGGTLRNCVLSGNGAVMNGGGALLYYGGCIQDSALRDNTAGANGGAVYAFLGGTVERCAVTGNRATGNRGGGLHLQQGGLVQHCTVTGNTAGQYQYGGGVSFSSGGEARNCLIAGNSAGYGGGVSFSGPGLVESCTIAGNTAITGAGGGANGVGTFVDTILYGNTAPSSSNYTGGTFAYCCAAPAPAGESNSAANPMFLSAPDTNYRLATNSPAVNAGTNLAWMSGAADLDGNARVAAGTADIGAYEQGRLFGAFTATPIKGLKPLDVQFAAAVAGTNVNGLYYRWDMDNNGTYERQGAGSNAPAYTYAAAGVYTVRFVVSNAVGEVATQTRTNYITALVSNVHYVATNGAHIYPYTSWAEAARDVQSAVDAALDSGGTIRVSNGVYKLAGQITVAKPVAVRSVNGAAVTTIDGNRAVRCFHVAHVDAVVDGFTLTGGQATDGAGAYLAGGGTVQNCLVVSNTANSGGGVYLSRGGTLRTCTVVRNTATGYTGGGVNGYVSGVVENCLIVSNAANTARGGGVCVNGTGVVVRGCAILGNTAAIGGGIAFDAAGKVVNCTVVGNAASQSAGGINSVGTVLNSIVYYNTAPGASNHTGGAFGYSCTVPDPGGTNNVTAAPGLLSLWNAHIVSNAPCIDAGTNTDLTGAFDFEGEARTNGPRVDMGADEFWSAGITGALSVAALVDFTNAVVGWPLNLQSVIQGKAHRFEWRFGDGRTATNLCVLSHTYTNAGTFAVVLSAWNNAGLVAATTTVRIAGAFTNYVSPAGSHTPPFTNWATAARILQDGVDANTYAGGVTLVAPAVYDVGGAAPFGFSNRVALVRPVTLLAADPDPAATTIRGSAAQGAEMRCAYVGSGARLAGFTLTGGSTRPGGGDATRERSGGGAFCEAGGALSNCQVTANWAERYGGGIYCNAGAVQDCIIADNAAYQGGGVYASGAATIRHSTLRANTASSYGAGVFGGAVIDCRIEGNATPSSSGGGAYLAAVQSSTLIANSATYGAGAYAGTLKGCDVCSNTASYRGGGLYNGSASNCTIRGNTAVDAGGGGYSGTMVNCLVTGNSAFYGGGTHSVTVESCTIVGNTATYGGGLYYGAPKNSIIYFNSAQSSTNYYSTSSFQYCCALPLPSGTSNTDANPRLLDAAGGDGRLATNSPCIDAGTNQAWMAGATDLAGNPRVAGVRVDMGCHEAGPLGCAFAAEPAKGVAPLTVAFTAIVSGTNAANLYYRWDFDNNGVVDAQGWNLAATSRTYAAAGFYSVGLWASNALGEAASCVRTHCIVAMLTNVCYVALDGAHVPPFDAWSRAATNLQAAVDMAPDGGLVLVSNGVFRPPAPVNVTRPVTVRGALGAAATHVDGAGARRCFTLSGTAVIEDLTITNGYASGSDAKGSGVFCDGGGTLRRCVVAGNRSASGTDGPAVYVKGAGTVASCRIVGNTTAGYVGAGVCLAGDGLVADSVIADNVSTINGGGGIYLTGGLVRNCLISGNSAPESGGARCEGTAVLENCLVVNNTTTEGGGGGLSCYYGGTVRNCTVSGNTSAGVDYSSGGVYCENGGTVVNTIMYFNNAANADHYEYGSGASHANCCTAPAVGSDPVTDDPGFVDPGAGNYRLATNSPCIGAGVTQDWMTGATDYEGKPRVLDGGVEIGAIEFIPRGWDTDGDGMPDWWEWDYAGTTTGMLAGADADGDAFGNRDEYRAGTVPDDPASLLGISAMGRDVTGGVTGLVVRWHSVAGRRYRLERGTNLLAVPPCPVNVSSNILAVPPMNTQTDTTAVGRGPWFYRVGLEE